MSKYKLSILIALPFAFYASLILFPTNSLAQEETETTVDACVGTCSPAPTPTPSATPTATPTTTATATPTATATATPAASPTATPLPTPVVLPGEFVIYGYGPPNSTINMTGVGVSETTMTDDFGLFEFRNLPFPTILSALVSLIYPDICFEVVDDQGRVSNPTCIPGLPDTVTTDSVGPILLSPTISIEKDKITIDESIAASGKTYPNTKVQVHFARQDKVFLFNVVSSVAAYSLPTIDVVSDDEGNYEFNLPSIDADDWKVFTSAEIDGQNSTNSNILNFSVKPSIYKAVKVYEEISYYIKPTLFKFIVFAQSVIIGLLLFMLYYINKRDDRYVKEYAKSPNKSKLGTIKGDTKNVHRDYEKLLRSKLRI